MQLTLESHDGIVLQSWEPGLLKANGQAVTHHCIVSSQSIERWQPADSAGLTVNDFAPLVAAAPEIILLGTGKLQRFPDIALVTEIMQQGIAFEVMDTGAACRTFNILVGERRPVVAALLID